MQQILPGIRHIFFLPPQSVSPHLDRRYEAKLPCHVVGNQTEIPFTGIPLLTLESTPDNGSTLETAKLTFNTSALVNDGETPICLVQTVQGTSYLMGRREAPYPIIKYAQSSGSPDGEAAQTRVEITFTARHALIPSIV